jgi:PAS domain S-box-containing protein
MMDSLVSLLRATFGDLPPEDPRFGAFCAALERWLDEAAAREAEAHSLLAQSQGELRGANEELRAAREQFERRVAERTAELVLLNDQLQREIGERRRTEAELRQAELRYRFLVENLPAVTYIAEFGYNGPWHYVSPQIEPMLGYPADIWLRDPGFFYERIIEEDRGVVRAEEERCERALDRFSVDYRIRAADGRVRWIHDEGLPVPRPTGRPMMQGFLFDVTEHRQLEEQLLHARKVEAVGHLAGGIAHDFNNILTAIVGYAELLRSRLPAGHAQQAEVGEILRAGERASRVTGKLLAFSRRQNLAPRQVEINGLLADLASFLRRLVGDDVVVELRPAAALPSVFADPTQLEQVILNLVVNARDAMAQGGTVTLETRSLELATAGAARAAGLTPGRYVELRVADTGVGIDETIRPRLFEPFFTTKPEGKGTGLGLATVYGIVRQSGGSVLVESVPGHGATFRVLLPMAREESPATADGDAVRAVPAPTGKERILLVEDESTVRNLLGSLLSELGYEVHSAANGEEALSLVAGRTEAEPWDLLLTDVVMPGLSGPALARRLRDLQPGLRVLFVSGHASQPEELSAMLGDRGTFLPKPFSPIDLARAVRELLDR